MVDSSMDKSHEHLYKSKITLFSYCELRFWFFDVLYSHSHWRCLCWENMFTEPLSEESTAKDSRSNHWRGVCHQKCKHERWCDGQSAVMGHSRAGKVQSNYRCTLSQGSRLPHRLRRDQSQDLQQCQILALVSAWLGRAGHMHHARG